MERKGTSAVETRGTGPGVGCDLWYKQDATGNRHMQVALIVPDACAPLLSDREHFFLDLRITTSQNREVVLRRARV